MNQHHLRNQGSVAKLPALRDLWSVAACLGINGKKISEFIALTLFFILINY